MVTDYWPIVRRQLAYEPAQVRALSRARWARYDRNRMRVVESGQHGLAAPVLRCNIVGRNGETLRDRWGEVPQRRNANVLEIDSARRGRLVLVIDPAAN